VGIVKIRSLDEFKEYASPVFFVSGIWNSGREIAEALEADGLPVFQLEENDLVDMIAYIKRSGVGPFGEGEVFLPPPSPKNGHRLFLTKGCVECHSGEGARQEAFEGLALGPFTHIVRRMLNHVMWSGPARPALLAPEEMSDLVSYIYFLSYVGKPGDPEVGKALFVDRKCVACHGADTASATGAPNFGRLSKLKTPLDVLGGMWNSAPEKMEEAMLEAGVPWPEFKGEELADLFAYILSAGAE
jgi:mono/diheme cytochrome c family protein